MITPMIVAIIINAISPSVYDFGAHGDGRHTLAAVRRSSGTVESRGPVFAPTDVGKALICVGCRTRGNLIGRIVSVSRDRKTIRIEPRADRDAAQATLYWGTPDDTAFERMSKAGKRMRIPAARNSFFLLLKTWRLERLPGLIIAGDGERSLLLGDPGDHELVLLSGSPNAAISGIHIANVHGAPDLYWFGLHLEEERHASITNSFFTGSRCAIQMDGGGEDIAITSSHFDAAITSAINANGDASAPIRGIRVENSFVRNTIWMDGAGGTGHDINLEDVSEVRVTRNRLEDNSTTIEGSSAIQVSTEAYKGTLRGIEISSNTATVVNPSAATQNICMDASSEPGNATRDYVVSNNTCRGYSVGFEWSGITEAAQVTRAVIRNNHFLSLGGSNNNGGIFFTGTATGRQAISVAGNEIQARPDASTRAGIAVNRVNGLVIRGNLIPAMPIALAGVQDTSVIGNHSSAITCETYGRSCLRNRITENTISP